MSKFKDPRKTIAKNKENEENSAKDLLAEDDYLHAEMEEAYGFIQKNIKPIIGLFVVVALVTFVGWTYYKNDVDSYKSEHAKYLENFTTASELVEKGSME